MHFCILITISLTSVSKKFLASILFSPFFLKIPPALSLGDTFFASPLWLSVYFYVLNRTAMILKFAGVAFCGRYLVGPSCADSLITWAGCSRHNTSVRFVGPPVVIGSWLLLCIHRVAQPLGWLTVGSILTRLCKLLCRCWPNKTRQNKTKNTNINKKNQKRNKKAKSHKE